MDMVTRNNSLIPSFFDDFFNRGGVLLKVNIIETDRDFTVEMAAPGMRKEDFNIELNNNMLSISSERTQDVEENADNSKYNRREFSYESFSRSFYLPDNTEADKIKAKYQDGILRLIIPKKKGLKQKSVKTIRIS